MIGIDPGKSGAVAWLNGDECRVWRMPETPDGLAELLATLDGPITLEKVHAGGTANAEGRRMGASSAFTFGCGFGVILGVLAATNRRHDLVTPIRWTGSMGLRGKSKHQHTSAARRLYPQCYANGKAKPSAITHYAADAVLLAEYGRRFLWGAQTVTGERNGGCEPC